MAASEFRVEDERFDPTGAPERRRSWWQGCLIGCLIAVVVILLVAGLVAWWVARNWRDWVSTAASEGIKQGIDASDLPAGEKEQIKVEVDRVVLAFRDNRLSAEQVEVMMQKFMESPVLTALIASAAEKNYIDKSGLNDEERAEARITLRRFLRGSVDGKINEQAFDAAIGHVATKQPDGNWEFREKVSDAELRAFLAEAKQAADAAQIPEQAEAFDPSDEVKRIIDEAMNAPAELPESEPDGRDGQAR
jgi:preprotein translocase subunit SecD